MTNILRHLNSKDWALIGVCLVFIVIQVWFDLKLPEYMGTITRLVTTDGHSIEDVWQNGQYMLLCAFGSLATAVVVSYIASRIGASFAQRLRRMQFDKVDSFSMTEINRFSTASLITRSTNDVTQVQMLLMIGLQIIIKAPIITVWAILKISGRGFEWTLATVVAMIIIALVFVVVIILVIPKFRMMQTLTDNLNDVTRENLTGLPVVRAYNAEDYQEAKFEKANRDLTDTQLYTAHAMATMMPFILLLTNVLMLAIYWIGAILISGASAPESSALFADTIVFVSYAMQVMMAVLMIMMLFVMLPRAQVSARRISEVIDTEPSIKDGPVTKTDPAREGEIEFRNVSFKYPGAADYTLQDISFSVNKGETVAFIGSTGSGKSTLVNLVPRFYDTTEGTVLVGGVDVREYRLDSLYGRIGYIPQKSVLFSGTVSSNVAFGEREGGPAGEDDIRSAVRIAQGKDFVEEMDGAYEAEIVRGGTNVSGGQKQRLSIARAIYKNPEIYIFDDSFSALDYKTDRVLRTALKKETGGVTSMIVAQRIGTIMDADKIIVLDEGRVAGVGKHKELLRTCKVYKEIAASQLSEEELAI
ncbi:MAG: ABC transporter ATP-binding protein/permease [Candidatus Methanoplasma sp.]|jgi:ATP-binding cassette subfamily B protein|nr:ABC transporter ATP-binding protein/permease [Candidatus Methanoplasma sp.]